MVRRFFGEARRYPLIPIAVVLIMLVIPAIFAEVIAPYDPLDGDLRVRLLPPAWIEGESEVKNVVAQMDPSKIGTEVMATNAARMVRNGGAVLLDGATEAVPGTRVAVISKPGGTWEYPLGTDKVGRDILSRIIYGSRISVVVAALSILCGGVIGTALGVGAGYFGKWLDIIVMRAVDISLSIPIILLALVLVDCALGASFATIIVVLVLLLWAHYARMARGETLSVRVQDFVARSRVAGSSHPPHHGAPHLSQRVQQSGGAGDAASRVRHHPGKYPQLPGRRYPTSHSGVGVDGRRRSRIGYIRERLVGLVVPRLGDHVDRAVYEPARRLAARQAGPQAAPGLNLQPGETKPLIVNGAGHQPTSNFCNLSVRGVTAGRRRSRIAPGRTGPPGRCPQTTDTRRHANLVAADFTSAP